jgi:translocation and assembly module TamB
MARLTRLLAWLLGGALLLILVLVAGLALLIETGPGHDLFLRMALRQLPRYINGDIQIAGIRSGGLLQGFTLRGVAIRDENGRPFVEADSIAIGYSTADLFRRRIVFVPVASWGVRVTVETLPGDTLSNFRRILPTSDPEQASSTSPGFSLALRDATISGGEFILRLPRAAGEAGSPVGVIETFPELGGEVLTLRFSNVEALLTEGIVLDPGGGGFRLNFDRVALDAHLSETPLHLEEFRGEILIEGSQIAVSADRLWFPDSELAGEILLDLSDRDLGVRVDAGLEASVFSLSDLHWFAPSLPDGEGELTLSFDGYLADGELRLSTTDFRTERSRARGEVGIDFARMAVLPGSEVEIVSLDLEEVTSWTDALPALTGHLSGNVGGEGEFNALELDGTIAFEDPARGIPSTELRFEGGVRIGEDPGFVDFSFAADPFNYRSLSPFLTEREISGMGSILGTLSGRLVTGVTLTAEVVHTLPDLPSSHLRITGSVSRPGEDFIVDLEGVVEPLSLDALAVALGEDLPASGELSGEVLASGTMRDLSLSAALSSSGGTVTGVAQIDLLDPEGRYRFEGEVEDFLMHALIPVFPDSTRMTGEFFLDGRGRQLETVDAQGSLNLIASKVAGVDLDRLDLRLRASGGELRVEELELVAPLLRLSGTGAIPLVDDIPEGQILIAWEAASFDVLRPLIFGPDPIAVDTLSALEREVLRMNGVDVDTIGAEERSRMEGSAHGELRLTGRISNLTGDGFVEVADLIYGETEVASGRADFVGNWVRDSGWEIEGDLDVQGLSANDFDFERGGGEVRLGPGAAEFALRLDRNVEETLRVEGELSRDSTMTTLDLGSVVVQLEDVTWELVEPARIRWEDSIIAIESFRIARPAAIQGGEGVQIEARGTIGEGSATSLRIEASQLELARIERILQREDLPDGLLEFTIDVGGPFESPSMSGTFVVRDLVANGGGLTTLEGEVEYLDQRLDLRINGGNEGTAVVSLTGSLPLDLSFGKVEGSRLLEREIDLTLSLTELPAAMISVFLGGIEEVQGVLDGEVHLGGTPRDFRPNGRVVLREGSLLLPELGIRPSAIAAEFRLLEDGTLEVDAEARSPGTLRASGTVALSNLRDPGFTLAVEANGFQAVQRRDLSARIGGSVVLTGSYNAPQISGSVSVEQGEMFLEEFARSAEVVSLSDRFSVDVIDTTLVSLRPVIDAAQNPFIQNLFVQVDMAIGRDFWLRSREMDVEIGGALIVTFDRPKREIVMSGTLDAIRGSYNRFGRQFEVVGGTVEFAGTPGIDPALNIQAVARLRRAGAEALNVTANVQGTLTAPDVTLTSDAQPAIAEADLYSYLIFGRPTYALASGESSVLAGAAGAGLTLGIGTLASQVGTVVAREIGLDYFTITQDQEGMGIESLAGLSNSFVGTKIEMGQYVSEDIFLAFVLRPISGVGSGSRLPGARLEWKFADDWSLEGFVEDRFAREGASGFGELGLKLSKVLGVSLFREWGY